MGQKLRHETRAKEEERGAFLCRFRRSLTPEREREQRERDFDESCDCDAFYYRLQTRSSFTGDSVVVQRRIGFREEEYSTRPRSITRMARRNPFRDRHDRAKETRAEEN